MCSGMKGWLWGNVKKPVGTKGGTWRYFCLQQHASAVTHGASQYIMDQFQHTGGSVVETHLALRIRHSPPPPPCIQGAEPTAVAILFHSGWVLGKKKDAVSTDEAIKYRRMRWQDDQERWISKNLEGNGRSLHSSEEISKTTKLLQSG